MASAATINILVLSFQKHSGSCMVNQNLVSAMMQLNLQDLGVVPMKIALSMLLGLWQILAVCLLRCSRIFLELSNF